MKIGGLMSSIKNRNDNLDALFGIIPQDITPESKDLLQKAVEIVEEKEINPVENKPIDPNAPPNFSKEEDRLDHIYEVSKDVLDNFSEIATSYGRSKDIIAVSQMVLAMTSAVEKSISIKEKKALIDNLNKGGGLPQVNVQQNNIFTGDSRDLFNLIKNATKGADIVDAKKDEDEEKK
jgi:hypothetical protein